VIVVSRSSQQKDRWIDVAGDHQRLDEHGQRRGVHGFHSIQLDHQVLVGGDGDGVEDRPAELGRLTVARAAHEVEHRRRLLGVGDELDLQWRHRREQSSKLTAEPPGATVQRVGISVGENALGWSPVGPLEPVLEEILAAAPGAAGGEEIGLSREGRSIRAWRFGSGPTAASLIAGCHADEPVGPELLRRLSAYLGNLPGEHPLLSGFSWSVVPHVNPDGERRNAIWSRSTTPVTDHRGSADRGFGLAAYLEGAVRELPGDDVEFGFPRGGDDIGARPENRAVAEFLAAGAPYRLHASLHGMGFAPGVWFLLEESWAGRTEPLRRALGHHARRMGYPLLDIDRRGEKGFRKIAEGFSTRPDSRAMAAWFQRRGEPETAALFRPSSMELARSLGGDPLTVVSEMPLFLLEPEGTGGPPFRPGTEGGRELRRWLDRLVAEEGEDAERLASRGVRPMPLGDQMRLQLALIDAGLSSVVSDSD
jgi:hypothetical protein